VATRATIRAYQAEDLSRILQLWQWTDSLPVGPDGLTVDQAVELIVSGSTVTLVAEAEGELVGMVVGSAVAAVGWIHRLTVLPEGLAGEQVVNELLGKLEASFAEAGVRRIATVVRQDDPLCGHLERRGYDPTGGVLHLERRLPDTVAAPSGLAELGGRMIHPGLWSELKGLEDAKQVIERRVILPLAEPELAARHAIAPPRAIVLFGPPGTGKTTFAKASPHGSPGPSSRSSPRS
jgi:transitional endoplasmic reticulum ATPase